MFNVVVFTYFRYITKLLQLEHKVKKKCNIRRDNFAEHAISYKIQYCQYPAI